MGVRRCCECMVICKVGLEMFVVFARGGGGVQRLLGLICWVAQLFCSCFLFQTYIGERIELGFDVPDIADSCCRPVLSPVR